jgi:hypothetical protein
MAAGLKGCSGCGSGPATAALGGRGWLLPALGRVDGVKGAVTGPRGAVQVGRRKDWRRRIAVAMAEEGLAAARGAGQTTWPEEVKGESDMRGVRSMSVGSRRDGAARKVSRRVGCPRVEEGLAA